MKYGVFSSVYGKYGIAEAAEKIKAAGFEFVQLVPVENGRFLAAREFVPSKIREITAAYRRSGLQLIGISGGFRFLAPDQKEREQVLEETKRWIKLAPELGTDLVVTEIGSKHPSHNWTDCPENHTEKAWKEAVAVYRTLTRYAKRYGVTIGIEPHFAAVIQNSADLQRIREDVGADNLKIVLDPANSITAENAANQVQELEELFERVGANAVLAHAKDTAIVKGESVFVPAGKGVLPYRTYFSLLKKQRYTGPLVLEYLEEAEAVDTLNWLKQEEAPPYLRTLLGADPKLYENTRDALELVHGTEGALELKYRLLLSMVADALERHPEGAAACAREAIEAGATREQVAEAFRVVYTAGGLPAILENLEVYREVFPS